MLTKLYDEFAQALEKQGTDAALDLLEKGCLENKNYPQLFEVLLLRARLLLGVSLLPSLPSERTPELQKQYEDMVVAACRRVGELYLADRQFRESYRYFQMVDDLGPLRTAIEKAKPANMEEEEELIEIALMQRVAPKKGMDLLLKQGGICQGITLFEQSVAEGLEPGAQIDCAKLLVRHLHGLLAERLKGDIAEKEGDSPATASITVLLKDRSWLFADDNYHVDTSHLGAVVRIARLLPKCDETFLAIQLCEYGCQLSEKYKYPEASPFDQLFEDSLIYFKAVAGLEVDKGLEHFRNKAQTASIDEVGNWPWQVYVDLLASVGRYDEAISVAGKKINGPEENGLTSPINELCFRAKKYDQMAMMAKRRNDLMSYVVGMIASKAK